MKEDILEQMVEDWFVAREGWFVKHNIRYRPSKNHRDYNPKKDSVHSDIDILGYSSFHSGTEKVACVTCKSWQGGFKISDWIDTFEGEATYNEQSVNFQHREKWKYFREVISAKWIDAFLTKIEEETGQRDFTYYIAVTRLIGTPKEREMLETSQIIRERFKKFNSNIQIKILTLEEIVTEYTKRLNEKSTPVLEATDVGRMLQLFKAAEIKLNCPTLENSDK